MFRFSLLFCSFVIVAFGQPAWSSIASILSYLVGYGICFRGCLEEKSSKKRFFIGLIWFAAIQMVQLSWLLTHPFAYIYFLYFFLALWLGIQFGIITFFINEKIIRSSLSCLALAGGFTLLEWSRLYFLCGFSFNPIGLSLSGTLVGLQMASLGGIFLLSFWVLVVNFAFLRAWVKLKLIDFLIWIVLAMLPFIYGSWHLQYHQSKMDNDKSHLQALLVQTAFPVEESMVFSSYQEAVQFVLNEWNEILRTVAPYYGREVDLVALPEYVVPFGTYMAVFPFELVQKQFEQWFGKEALTKLPPLSLPYAMESDEGWMVTNAYYAQALSNLLHADLITGFQDDQPYGDKLTKSYSAALYFWEQGKLGWRYEKRVLLPMAEYIPFDFCKEIAKTYGIGGSFTCGTAAKVFPGVKAPFGLSICYEETYGGMMRESRVNGAHLLINLTSDVWYPNSRLPKQHFDHARLRTVENGIPLLRACNTGITSVIDSLGQTVATLGDDAEWERKSLYARVPLYHFTTIYTLWGDAPIMLLSTIFILTSLLFRNRK